MNQVIVVATGKNSKINIDKAAYSIEILGQPMLQYLIDELDKLDFDKKVCVVEHPVEDFIDKLHGNIEFIIQSNINTFIEPIRAAEEYIDKDGLCLILPGNCPFASAYELQRLVEFHRINSNDLTLGTIHSSNPYGFGRILRANDRVKSIVEEIDATNEQKKIEEINTGIFCIKGKLLYDIVNKNRNKANEDCLSYIVAELSKEYIINTFTFKDELSCLGINDLVQLEQAEKLLIKKINESHMRNGIRLINSESIVIHPNCRIGKNTIIHPNCCIYGESIIGEGCSIESGSIIKDSNIHNLVTIKQSVIEDSEILDNSLIGPYAHIRNNSIIGASNRIGNFVEVKNSTIGSNTNAAHLSYIGDTTCGSHVNWGCGTITSNYDGEKKHRTTIGDYVFIGCNSNLIAPIALGDKSFVAAGSTITSDLSEDDFAIARSKQITKRKYATKYSYSKKK